MAHVYAQDAAEIVGVLENVEDVGKVDIGVRGVGGCLRKLAANLQERVVKEERHDDMKALVTHWG